MLSESFYLMNNHVSPYTACCGECHMTTATLVSLLSIMTLKVMVEATSTDEGLAALETHIGPLSCVRSIVLFEV